MSYKSPIDLVMGTPQTSVDEIRDSVTGLIEKEVVNTILKLKVNVDKDELIKALEYDRHQYEKGYADAINHEIIHCKDCKHWIFDGVMVCERFTDASLKEDDFCSYGERR